MKINKLENNHIAFGSKFKQNELLEKTYKYITEESQGLSATFNKSIDTLLKDGKNDIIELVSKPILKPFILTDIMQTIVNGKVETEYEYCNVDADDSSYAVTKVLESLVQKRDKNLRFDVMTNYEREAVEEDLLKISELATQKEQTNNILGFFEKVNDIKTKIMYKILNANIKHLKDLEKELFNK